VKTYTFTSDDLQSYNKERDILGILKLVAGIIGGIAVSLMITGYKMEQEHTKQKEIEKEIKIVEVEKEIIKQQTPSEPKKEPPQRKSKATQEIQPVYKLYNSPISHKVNWVVTECEKRGLNPYLVLAVQAQESGWGKNCYFGNCFGYGLTEDGNLPDWYGDTYENITIKILDSYAIYYNVNTAEEMRERGYNHRQSWVDRVNLIMSYFN